MKLLTFILLVFTINAYSANLTHIRFMTEDSPPYNFQENQQPQGIAVDLLKAAAKQQGYTIQNQMIHLQPWARAYKEALNGPMTALFVMARTPEREALFQWVGPITKTSIVILAKKARHFQISSHQDLKSYIIGAVRDDVGAQELKRIGIPDANIQLSAFSENAAKKLSAQRINMWAYEHRVALWILKRTGQNTHDFEVVHTLKESELYFGLSKDVPKQYLDTLQNGIQAVQESGEFDKILLRYQ
ncbi:substrate-binding periplasmic protein [Algicola sagamiensis]|uniref:substrate-binding periplasmic protein n=1 Tax=Algicola sagamiensis TaxID=163869 RepID=UPI0003A4449B|nr:transporter substrate-binding domain-containing protein [Algicola sagamiensis]